MKDLVSVIIPVYNVSAYLKECLESVILQSYQNLEIILVDDGSTDNSGEICEEYKKKDTRIKVIHKENGGQSDARNVALDIAMGDYITFIDSDDYVNKEYVEKMLFYAKKEECDLVVCSRIKFYEHEEFEKGNNDVNDIILYSQRDAVLDMLYGRKLFMYSWGKLYEKKLLSDTRFPKGKLFEDVTVTWEIMKKVSKVLFVDSILYYYLQRSGSTINSNYSSRKLAEVHTTGEILDELRGDEELVKAAIARYFFCLVNVYTQVDNEHISDKKFLEDGIRNYRKTVLLDRKNDIKLRVMAALSYISLKCVRWTGRIYKRISNKK